MAGGATVSERTPDLLEGLDVAGLASALGVAKPEPPASPDSLPAILTIEEVASFLRIGRASAYRAARRGDLPCVRIGKTLRVSRDRLLRWLEQGCVPLNRRKTA